MAEKEYIEREAVMEYLCRNLDGTETVDIVCTPVAYGCKLAVEDTRSFVKTLPTADVVEVQHGEWKNDGEDWFCNRCNRNALCDKMTGEEVLTAICPCCGAKMDGKGEGE